MLRKIPFGIKAVTRPADSVAGRVDQFCQMIDGHQRPLHYRDHCQRNLIDSPHPPPEVDKIDAITRKDATTDPLTICRDHRTRRR